MKTTIRWSMVGAVGLILAIQWSCRASLFEMSLEKEALYSPAHLHLNLYLTDKAKIQGPYQFKVNIFMIDTLVRQQTLIVTDRAPVAFELEIPEVLDQTAVRCRTELLLDGNFMEAKELPLILYPLLAPYAGYSLKDKTLWVYDTSGKLQALCEALEVKVVDATFQAAREFGTPDIVIIGENTDPNHVQLVTERFNNSVSAPVFIYLKQIRFPRELKLEVPSEALQGGLVTYPSESSILKNLSSQDILALVTKSVPVRITPHKDEARQIQSYISESSLDSEAVSTYLCTIQHHKRIAVYCQLPAVDLDDPRSILVLTQLLQYATNPILMERK